MYELAVLLHVVAAVFWVGGGLYAQIVATRLANAGNDNATAAFTSQIEWSGLRLFMPSSLEHGPSLLPVPDPLPSGPVLLRLGICTSSTLSHQLTKTVSRFVPLELLENIRNGAGDP